MGRNYAKKRRESYTLEDLHSAVLKIKNNELNVNKAAQIYGIPRTTLYDKIRIMRAKARKKLESNNIEMNNTKEKSDQSDSDDDNILNTDSELWGFFDKHMHRTAKCSICGAIIQRESNMLYSHLKEEHSTIAQNMETRDNDTFTEIVYLEDTDRHNEKKQTLNYHNTTKNLFKRQKSPHKLQKTDEFNKNNAKDFSNKENEIDLFGKYISVLLKDVPTDTCQSLQKDILDLIMNAKLKEPNVISNINIEPEQIQMQTEEVQNETFINVPIINESERPQELLKDATEEIYKSGQRQKHRFHYSKEIQNTAISNNEDLQIECFGKYVTSLLKDIPCKNIGTKIQMEIVNLIMVARMNMKSNAKILTVDGTIEIESNL